MTFTHASLKKFSLLLSSLHQLTARKNSVSTMGWSCLFAGKGPKDSVSFELWSRVDLFLSRTHICTYNSNAICVALFYWMFFGVRVFVNFALSLCSLCNSLCCSCWFLWFLLQKHWKDIWYLSSDRKTDGVKKERGWCTADYIINYCTVDVFVVFLLTDFSYYLRFEYHIFCHFVIKQQQKWSVL